MKALQQRVLLQCSHSYKGSGWWFASTRLEFRVLRLFIIDSQGWKTVISKVARREWKLCSRIDVPRDADLHAVIYWIDLLLMSLQSTRNICTVHWCWKLLLGYLLSFYDASDLSSFFMCISSCAFIIERDIPEVFDCWIILEINLRLQITKIMTRG